jgi:hypothetical protein
MRFKTLGMAAVLLAVLAGLEMASAQQAQPKSPAKRTEPQSAAPKQQPAAPKQQSAKTPAARPAAPQKAASSADAARKAEILNSYRWRRAMFERNEWLSAQTIYDKKKVEEIKADLAAQVATMSADDLQFMLDDMEAKFQILESKDAQEARAWLSHYLSIRTKARREEIIKSMPDFATMSAAQLSQEIVKIDQKRGRIAAQQAQFDYDRGQQVDSALAANRQAQQAYLRDRSAAPTAATYSPYRSQPSVQVSHAPLDSGPSYTVGPAGGIYMTFNPSSY